MTKNETVQIDFEGNHQMKYQFLKDPKSDIFVVLQNKIIPLHRNVVASCSYFLHRNFQNEKVFFFDEGLDMKALLKVFAYLYGHPSTFVRNSEGIQIFQCVTFLGVSTLQSFFLKDFDANFEEYGVFLLYHIGKKFRIQWLEKKCLDDLISCSFEQFYIKKYDLMNSDQETFEKIVKHHQVLKSKGYTEGLSERKIKGLIQEYQSVNSTEVDADEVLSLSIEDHELTEKIIKDFQIKRQIKRKDSIRKRKATWNCSTDVKGLNSRVPIQIDTSIKKATVKISQKSSSQNELLALQLREINSDIIKQSTSMISEIKEAQLKTRNSDLTNQKRLQNVGRDLSQIASIFEKQTQKIAKTKSIADEMKWQGLRF